MPENSELDSLIEEFLIESYENLDQLDQDLVTLEEDPSNLERLSRIFRTIHTLKGSCGFLGFTTLEAVAHVGENLLSRLREGELALNAPITTALLSLVDAVRQMLAQIETTGREGDADYTRLIETLSRLQTAPGGMADTELEEAEEASLDLPEPDEGSETTDEPAEAGLPQPARREQPRPGPAQPSSAPSTARPGRDTRAPGASDTSIRVDVGLLDMLMDQVGELVLARNRIMQFSTYQEDRSIIAAYQRLDLITTELQESVMKTRMQPIGTIWNKFPRVVRDLALECGKKVNLTMDGEETELDRTLIEAIKDPLTHLVRNAVDHGIEPPDVRRAARKPEAGTLSLRAFHEGGQVNIEIADDGGGIDAERVAQKAIDRNLVTAQQLAQMTPREILNLIFIPGFSTAEKVTNVSGRGVGMDVVKNNIEKINGAIDIQSEVGRGTTIKVKIPLTLAIIPALLVRCAGERYAIPQASLVELVRLERGEAHKKIELIHGAPVYRLRGQLLPLVYLHREFTGEMEIARNGQPDDSQQPINIVVLQADERLFGLVVEGVNDTEEIVVKPMGKQLKDLAVFAGATIMGDGRVALILDVLGLAQRAHVVSERRETGLGDASAQAPAGQRDRQLLLLVESAAGDRMALPLSGVARLEKFTRSAIERAGYRNVVQYRGQIMPLLDLSQALADNGGWASSGNGYAAEHETLEVVVQTSRGGSIGLVVDRIVDIVEETGAIQALKSGAGVIGTAVVQGQVTQLLDLDQIIQRADPLLFEQFTSSQ